MTKLRTKFTFMAVFLIYVLNWVCQYKYPPISKMVKEAHVSRPWICVWERIEYFGEQ